MSIRLTALLMFAVVGLGVARMTGPFRLLLLLGERRFGLGVRRMLIGHAAAVPATACAKARVRSGRGESTYLARATARLSSSLPIFERPRMPLLRASS